MKELLVEGAADVDVFAVVAEGSSRGADFAGDGQAGAVAAFEGGAVLDDQCSRAGRQAHGGEGEGDALIEMNSAELEGLVAGVLEFDELEIVGDVGASGRWRRGIVVQLRDVQPGEIVFEFGVGDGAPADDAVIDIADAGFGLERGVDGNRAGVLNSGGRDCPADQTRIGAVQSVIDDAANRVGIADGEAEVVADRPAVLIEVGGAEGRAAAEFGILTVG